MVRSIVRIALLSIVALFLVNCGDPLVLHVVDLPDNTPQSEPIFVAGNFNNWNPGDRSYQLQSDGKGGATIEIPRGIGHLEFKFTRGDWTSEEVDSCGNTIENRRISNLELNVVKMDIPQWKDRATVICNGVELYIRVPGETPIPNEIYLCGDFNGWALADSRFRAKHLGGRNYKIVLPADFKGTNYKINRGTWNTVEVSHDGFEMDNRRLGDRSEQAIVVENWKDICLQEHPVRYIVISDWPDNTPAEATLYFASNINGWNPSDFGYRFKSIPGGQRIIEIPNTGEPVEYKVTRGENWKTVEVGRNGEELDNRVLPFGIEDTIHIRVLNWHDLYPGN